MVKPVIGITMGDPAGIGPEIVIKALLNRELYKICIPVVIGDLSFLQYTAKRLKLNILMKSISSPSCYSGGNEIIEIVDLKNVNLKRKQIGKVSEEAGKASIEYIVKATKYALDSELDAIVTAPINKESIQQAGSPHIGHTELLGALTFTEKPMTMFLISGVRIFFLTRHVPLRKAIEDVIKPKIEDAVIKIDAFLRKMEIENPNIAVAALNPHASDFGLIGEEEKNEIIPAILELQKKGLNVVGPIPADSVFYHAFQGKYDAILSLYHDQGHIAAKTVDFHGTVSVTLGLPFVRTSVDHGTAFDIAGKGIANSKSLEEAIKTAARLASTS